MRAQDPPCPWDSKVCHFAAFGGHVDVLRWARSQGCRYGRRVTCAAATFGHLKVLKWLIKEGCPYDKGECREAARCCYVAWGWKCTWKVLEWLDE